MFIKALKEIAKLSLEPAAMGGAIPAGVAGPD